MASSSIAWIVIGLLCALTMSASAQLSVADVFADRMVLQRQQPVRVWGTIGESSRVLVTLTNGRQLVARARARVDADGSWLAELAELEAGGPYTLTVIAGAGQRVTFDDVLVGEVWIASGQSNMRWRVDQSDRQDEALAGLPDEQLRLMIVPEQSSPESLANPRELIPWASATMETAPAFSAVALQFGRELREATGVPVGLVLAAWGGTRAEAWTPREVLLKSAPLRSIAEDWVEPSPDAQRRAQERFELAVERLWNERLASEAGAATGGGDLPWRSVLLPSMWEDDSYEGVLWYRRSFALDAVPAHARLRMGPIDDFDVVYVNGVEVGRTPPGTANAWSTPRDYEIPAGVLRAGENMVAIRVLDWTGAGGIGGDAEALRLATSNGDVPLAGDWQGAAAWDGGSIGLGIVDVSPQHRPGGLWNAMVAPLAAMAVRGVIWYQGESNADRAEQYRLLFPTMINAWRDAFGADGLPFYLVQLANYQQPSEAGAESDWAELRDAQSVARELENVEMAVAIDIGEADDIHPGNKIEVGERLARIARSRLYGENELVFRGPRPSSLTFHPDRVVIGYDHAEGLMTNDGRAPMGFAVRTPTGWSFAKAEIVGQTVVLLGDDINAVRYAWADNPSTNLINEAGLPAEPFQQFGR